MRERQFKHAWDIETGCEYAVLLKRVKGGLIVRTAIYVNGS
jgi:hypothetical protein